MRFRIIKSTPLFFRALLAISLLFSCISETYPNCYLSLSTTHKENAEEKILRTVDYSDNPTERINNRSGISVFTKSSKVPSIISSEGKYVGVVAVGGLGGAATITTDVESVALVAEVGAEDIQYYSVIGSGFAPDDSLTTINISVSTNGYFTISTGDSNFGFNKSMEVELYNGEFQTYIAVKYAPMEAGTHSATISHSSSEATTNTLAVDGNASALPVQWHSFHGTLQNGNILLEWTTASEKSNSHFDIEVSGNPLAGFEKAGSISSKDGNSKGPQNYSHLHPINGIAGILYFRLKQVDTDNTFSYSRMIAVEVPASIELDISVAPNPVVENAQAEILVSEAGSIRMKIFNQKGIEIHSGIHTLNAGRNLLELPLIPIIPAGIYYLMTEFNGSIISTKFIKL